MPPKKKGSARAKGLEWVDEAPKKTANPTKGTYKGVANSPKKKELVLDSIEVAVPSKSGGGGGGSG
jgi:hypothetical protein